MPRRIAYPRMFGIIAVALLAACSKDKGGKDSTAAKGAAPAAQNLVAAGRSMHQLMVAVAESAYTYGAPREPETVSDAIIPGPGGSLPNMTIATATPSGSTSASAKFVSKIHSDSAYSTLGIVTGDNYVWRDSIGSGASVEWRVLIVPKDTTAPMVWLTRLNTQLLAGRPSTEMSRLAKSTKGYGVCEDCKATAAFPFAHCSSKNKGANFGPADSVTIRLTSS